MKTIVWFVFVLGALSAAGMVIVTKRGQKITFECGFSTYTRRLVWFHRDKLMFDNGRAGFPRKGPEEIVKRSVVKQMNLEISGVKEEDAGTFICEADSRRLEHTLVVVSVSAQPSGELQLGSEATLKCQVKGLNPPDSTVQWKRPDGSLLSVSQTVELKPVARYDTGTWECTFSHDGKTYSESLAIKVQEPAPETSAPSISQSPKDVRKTLCLDCVTHPPPDGALLLLGLSWWVWVAVGVGSLVVVLLVVSVIVLCKRIKRRNRKFRAMKNGRLPPKPKNYCQCDRPAAAAKPQQGRRREKPLAPPLQPLLMA